MVYLLYKNYSQLQDPASLLPPLEGSRRRPLPRWRPHSWLRWLFFGDSSQEYLPIIDLPSKQTSGSRKSSNIVYVSPCPNCVRGVCRIKKHHSKYHHQQFLPIPENESASTSGSSSPKKKPQLPPTSTADSADDESSSSEDEEDTNNKKLRKAAKHRVPPEGRERLSTSTLGCGDANCQDSFCKSQHEKLRIRREDSVDSLAAGGGLAVSGSMVDLVKGAREVRRLIREASFDSLASDFSLDLALNDQLGASTQRHLDKLAGEVSRIKDSCELMGTNIDHKQSFSCYNNNPSKSEHSIQQQQYSSNNCSSLLEGSSSPDLRSLRKRLDVSSQKGFWQMTAPLSDYDSPIHASSRIDCLLSSSSPQKDLKLAKYKVALTSQTQSSNASECGDCWEWDSEGLGGAPSDLQQYTIGIEEAAANQHEAWLPIDDQILELDLETELLSVSRSRSSSSDISSLYNKVRLPPSGRSSVSRDFTLDQDNNSPCINSINREMLVRSFAKASSSSSQHHQQRPIMSTSCSSSSSDRRKKSMSSSDESGYMEASEKSDMSTSMSTTGGLSATTPLSPVHEAKEPYSNTPVTSPAKTQFDRHWKRTKSRRKIAYNNSALPDLEQVHRAIPPP